MFDIHNRRQQRAGYSRMAKMKEPARNFMMLKGTDPSVHCIHHAPQVAEVDCFQTGL